MIGVTGGTVQDYYRFEFGPRSERYVGVRADLPLGRTRFGSLGIAGQFDTYRYNAVENYDPCVGCYGSSNIFLADVRRLAAGPSLRRSLGSRLDISGTALGGWAKRVYTDPGEYRGALEDESSHRFYSAEVGTGVQLRSLRLGAQWEAGFMRRVRTGTMGWCSPVAEADPLPGTVVDCRPRYGSRSFTRLGVVASYRIALR
jgi:hypothetical protein